MLSSCILTSPLSCMPTAGFMRLPSVHLSKLLGDMLNRKVQLGHTWTAPCRSTSVHQFRSVIEHWWTHHPALYPADICRQELLFPWAKEAHTHTLSIFFLGYCANGQPARTWAMPSWLLEIWFFCWLWLKDSVCSGSWQLSNYSAASAQAELAQGEPKEDTPG